MDLIPFTTFEGYLKKVDLTQQTEIVYAFFERAFPLFHIKRELSKEKREWIKATYNKYWPKIQIEEDIDPPRRFAGLPRLSGGRYHTICLDDSGNDGGTLADELRAYRYPLYTGRVGVADLMKEQLFGDARPAIAAIIYDIKKIPYAEKLINSSQVLSVSERNIYIIEFPCIVEKTFIERTIDLRLPDTQKWFYEKFSQGLKDNSIIWGNGDIFAEKIDEEQRKQLEQEAVTIKSRFKRVAGFAPKPTDFDEMLHTIMNPDMGGGIATEGGGILEAIGTWMRYNDVGALIYPSARSDVYIKSESGGKLNYGGWNLLDYRGASTKEQIKPSYFVPSPWAWTTFPSGTTIEFDKDKGDSNCGFSIVGLKAHLKRHYEFQTKGLEELSSYESTFNGSILFKQDSGVTRPAAWRLGSSSIEWLIKNVVDRNQEQSLREVLLFIGLAIRLDRSYAAGWMVETIWELEKDNSISKTIVECEMITDWIAETWQNKRMSFPDQILVLSNRLHTLKLLVANTLSEKNLPKLQNEGEAQLITHQINKIDLEVCDFSIKTKQAIIKTLEIARKISGKNSTRFDKRSTNFTNSWTWAWNKMHETVWDEMCGSQLVGN